jgi:uncharacterized damage-inducible protein DinB
MLHVWLFALTFSLAGTGSALQAADPTVTSLKGTFDLLKGNILKAAAQVPEDMYAFKPTPDIRSMGALFAHIADANFLICGAASGEKPGMTGIEKGKTTKKDIVAALEASFAFCDSAFSEMTSARASESVKFFLPGTHTRASVLAFNNAHDYEHYGNIVTYMRLKGLVPPSSQK